MLKKAGCLVRKYAEVLLMRWGLLLAPPSKVGMVGECLPRRILIALTLALKRSVSHLYPCD